MEHIGLILLFGLLAVIIGAIIAGTLMYYFGKSIGYDEGYRRKGDTDCLKEWEKGIDAQVKKQKKHCTAVKLDDCGTITMDENGIRIKGGAGDTVIGRCDTLTIDGQEVISSGKLVIDSDGIKGSGTLTTCNYDGIEEIVGLKITGAWKVWVNVGAAENSCKITIDDNLSPKIKVVNINGKVSIYSEDHILPTEAKIEIGICKSASAYSFSGACNVAINRAEGDSIKFQASGVSKIKVDELKAEKVKADLSGTAKISLQGTADNLKFQLTGISSGSFEGTLRKLILDASGTSKADVSGIIDAATLGISGASNAEIASCKNASIGISGMARVNIAVSDKLHVEASGMAKVLYTGSPKPHISKSGMADVRQIEQVID